MLELVMVIVVLGILAAVALPRMERDLRQEAGDNILSAIRYTQHLALMDDKTGLSSPGLPRNQWQRRYWHIRFSRYDHSKYWFYTISSSKDGDSNVDKLETTLDPANGKYMYHRGGDGATALKPQNDESPNIFLTKLYGIDTISFTGGCNRIQHLGFDHLGRPHVSFYTADTGTAWNAPITNDCTMTFSFKDGSDDLKINIARETGFAQIVDQNGS